MHEMALNLRPCKFVSEKLKALKKYHLQERSRTRWYLAADSEVPTVDTRRSMLPLDLGIKKRVYKKKESMLLMDANDLERFEYTEDKKIQCFDKGVGEDVQASDGESEHDDEDESNSNSY